MNLQFKNDYLEKIFQGKAVKGKPKYSHDVCVKFKKTILKLQSTSSFKELRELRSLNFESLSGNLKGFYSVRVDKKYRLILALTKEENLEVNDFVFVYDLSNHYQ